MGVIFTVRKIGIKDYLYFFLSILFIALIIYLPKVSAEGAKAGLYMSVNVLLPALFPFAVPVLYLINSGVFAKSKRPLLIVYLLSLIGGYPIGAKLLGEITANGKISKSEAEKYLPFCVNAGPAFIVIAVGKGILKSATIGYVLLAAHCVSSLIITAIFAPQILSDRRLHTKKPVSRKNNFAASVKGASGTCLNVCAFVILFSVINEYLIYFSESVKEIKYLIFITEISSAIARAESIYIISFLLGFAGISIWVQVYSVADRLSTKFLKFLIVRILCGALSAVICGFLLKVFKVKIAVLSDGRAFTGRIFYTNFALTLSLIIMVLLLLINITAKKHSRNFLKDML